MPIDWPRLIDLLSQHVQLSFAALGLALLIALPLAIWSVRNRTVAGITLGFASLVQTIPALALLALFFPLLLARSAVFGDAISPLGFLPSLLALTLYALLPILRNTVTGLRSVDPAMIEAADGVGMTSLQKLWLVEAPLASNTIMVTHDMAEALLFADRIWVMASGRIVADATPTQLIAGGCGPEAEALVAVPRLQAERITAMRGRL